LGEDKFVAAGDSKGPGFNLGMTPAEAKAEYGKMTMDQNVVKAMLDRQHPAHAEVMEKKARLMQLMHG
jgi:hypothetical protein